MSNNYWDNSGVQPNFARLPLHIREGMTSITPIRPDECNASLMIFKQTPGLNHPNARINVTTFRRDGNSGVSIESGAQVDFSDFTGRIALVTAVVAKEHLATIISGLLRVYKDLGGTDAATLLDQATAERNRVEGTAYFEERNDE